MVERHDAPPIRVPMLDLQAEVEALWDELNEAIQRVLRSGQFILGRELEAFEEEVAAYLGVKHAIGVNSGTDALVISLRTLGIGSGDEVITSPFSFFATVEAILSVGARPVFVDIDPLSFNIDVDKIPEALSDRTRAILPVHLFGRPVEMERLVSLAREMNLVIVEDCAQSFGSHLFSQFADGTRRRQMVGTFGDLGAFSFYPTKNLGGYGDGGLIVTDHGHLARTARELRNHGSLGRYDNHRIGYNSRLDELQAAILRVKLPLVDEWNERRREVARRYRSLLAQSRLTTTPAVTDGHVFHQYTIRVMEGRRDALQARLIECGVGFAVYYPRPIDGLEVVQSGPQLPRSAVAAAEVLSLPIHPFLRPDLQEQIAEAVVGFS